MLYSSFEAESKEMVRATSCNMTWEEIVLMEPEKVNRTLSTTSSATQICHSPPGLLRPGDWVWIIVNSLKKGMVLLAFSEAVVYFLLKGSLLDPATLDSFCLVSNLPILERVVEKWLHDNFRGPQIK